MQSVDLGFWIVENAHMNRTVLHNKKLEVGPVGIGFGIIKKTEFFHSGQSKGEKS